MSTRLIANAASWARTPMPTRPMAMIVAAAAGRGSPISRAVTARQVAASVIRMPPWYEPSQKARNTGAVPRSAPPMRLPRSATSRFARVYIRRIAASPSPAAYAAEIAASIEDCAMNPK